jgi:hypothetical protein
MSSKHISEHRAVYGYCKKYGLPRLRSTGRGRNFGEDLKLFCRYSRNSWYVRRSSSVTDPTCRSMHPSGRWSLWASAITINYYNYFCKVMNKHIFLIKSQYPEDEHGDGPRNVGFSPFNHLTRLVAWEDLVILSRRESSISYKHICS